MRKPFKGVDGNVLVEDLPYSHAVVESILNDEFTPRFWAEQFLPAVLLRNYPQLAYERAKRTHRRAYRAELIARLRASRGRAPATQ